MEKWRTKFVWQMGGCALLLLVIAGAMAEEVWFFRAKFLADPLRMLPTTATMVFGIVACLSCAVLCVKVIVSTQRHAAKMKALQAKRHPSLSLAPMSPEQKEEFRQNMATMFQSASLKVRTQVLAALDETMQQTARQLRAEHGSPPEVEAAIAEADELRRQVIADANTIPNTPEAAKRAPANSTSLSGILPRLFPEVAVALDSLQTWTTARAARKDSLGRVLTIMLVLLARLNAAAPGERSLRLMPVVILTVTWFAVLVALGALDRGRHVHEAVVLGVCTVGLWAFHLRERVTLRQGGAPSWEPAWWEEWGIGLTLTALRVTMVCEIFGPSTPHASAHHWPPAHILVMTLFALCLRSLVVWWMLVLRALWRPTAPRLPKAVA